MILDPITLIFENISNTFPQDFHSVCIHVLVTTSVIKSLIKSEGKKGKEKLSKVINNQRGICSLRQVSHTWMKKEEKTFFYFLFFVLARQPFFRPLFPKDYSRSKYELAKAFIPSKFTFYPHILLGYKVKSNYLI